jgi:uncharacterized protein
MQLSVAYDLLPKRRSVNAAVVMDAFGIDFETGPHVVADRLEIPVEAGDVVLFTGESGSGKSSLMRAVAESLDEVGAPVPRALLGGGHERSSRPPDVDAATAEQWHVDEQVVNVDDLDLGTAILVDGLLLPVHEAIALLTACGLGEPRLMLRTPGELSDGQRYRFRLALALSRRPAWVVADEFTATLDRTLAKVVAFNVRRRADRTGCGFLLATTHADVTTDLAPDLHVHCTLRGETTVRRSE